MAEKYLDHGLYASIGATPTWGVAQDGDGTAVGAATAATVSIDLSAATAAAGATFAIMGAVLTCVASGAGNNQFNAGSGATLVSNLVTAINRAANTVTCTAAPHNIARWKQPLVQNAVFARIGTPTTTIEIMTRAGSASYNGVGTIATASFTGGTFGPYTFSGGAGGAWGWTLNTVAAFRSGLAICTYGTWCQNGVLAGAFDGGDLVEVRGGKTITIPAASYSCIFATNMGGEFNPVRFRIGQSPVWSDGTDPVFTIQQTQTTAGGHVLSFGAIYDTSWVSIEGKRISEGVYNFNLTGRANYQTTVGGAKLLINGPMTITGCKLENTEGATTGFNTNNTASNNNQTTVLNDCYFKWNNVSPICSTGNGKQSNVIMNGCTFDNAGNTVAHPFIFNCEQYVATNFVFNGCRFINFVAGSQMFNQPSQAYGYSSKIVFSDCDFGNVTSRGPLFALQTTTYFGPQDKYIAVDDRLGKNEFAIDTCLGFIEWNASRSHPTLNALLADNSPWSIRVIPSTQATRAGVSRPIVLPDLAKRNTLGATKLRLKLEFLAEKSITPNSAKVSVVAYYKTSGGSREAVDSMVANIEPVASSAEWTQMLVDPADSVSRPTYVQGGTLYFNRYSLTVDTLSVVAADTDVTMIVMVRDIAADVSKMYFFDPEITMVSI